MDTATKSRRVRSCSGDGTDIPAESEFFAVNVQNVLPTDAIPSIDDPTFGSEFFGDPDDEVIVVDGDPPRAYPIKILSYHEIVNDETDGRPIAVTWCPICWSAAVYDRVMDGTTLTFGVSGKLADDALVMYDRETGSEWQQTTGEAIAGELDGSRLTTLSAPMVSWERFRADHPDGVVLQPVRGVDRSTGGSPADEYDMTGYERYVEGQEFGLYGMRGAGDARSWDREDIDAKTIVLGVEHGAEAIGYPIPTVEAAGGVVTDAIGDLDVVVFSTGDGIHAFENHGFESFEPGDGEFRAGGAVWDGTTGRSNDGRHLERIPAQRLFAFAWQDAHGPDAFYRLAPS